MKSFGGGTFLSFPDVLLSYGVTGRGSEAWGLEHEELSHQILVISLISPFGPNSL